MTFVKFGNIYILKLQKGEELSSQLESFAKDQGVEFGWISGLGALERVELGYYNLSEKQYHFKEFKGDLEITSLEGNISYFEDKPMTHIHLTISDKDQSTFGGHLKEGVVGGTLEIRLETFDQKIERSEDEETGLKLLKL